jgi:ABC-type branched-subunit amino acid transport system substrate-binding protein
MTRRLFHWAILLGLLTLVSVGCATKQKARKKPALIPPPPLERVNDAQLMRQADDLFSQESYHDAAKTYEQVLQSFPESPFQNEARYRLALCHYNLNQPTETVANLRRLVEFDLPPPRKVKVFSLMGESYLRLGKPLYSLRWHLAAREAADTPDMRSELGARIQQVLSENFSETELKEITFIYRDTYVASYAKFLLAQRFFETGRGDQSRQLLSEILRFHNQEDFFPDVEAFVEGFEGFAPNEYVLGAILPLSGPGALTFGHPSLNGIQLAIHAFEPYYDRINLRLIIKDSKSSPDKAAEAVEALVREEGVLAIVGPLLRATSEAAAQKAEELRVPLITLTTKEDIAQEGDFVFRNGLSYSRQIRSLVTYAIDYLGLRRFAVFYPNDGYGKTLSSLFTDEVYRLGGDVVSLETYANSQMDFGPEIRRMVRIQGGKTSGREDRRRYNPVIEFDGIFIPDQADRVALIAPQFAYYDIYGVTLLGTNAWNNPVLIEKAGKFVQDALLVDDFFSGSQSPIIMDFVNRFQSTFAEEPTILSAQAFDAASILVKLLEAQAILSSETMREKLTEIKDFSGVSGFTGFDPAGNAKKKPVLLTIQQDGFRELSSEILEILEYQ